MEDRRKNIDDLFREGLNDFKESPSPDVWKSLEQRLPAKEPASRRWMWWLLLLAVLATVGYFVISKTSENSTRERKINYEKVKDAPASNTISNPAGPASNSAKKEAENLSDKSKENYNGNETTGDKEKPSNGEKQNGNQELSKNGKATSKSLSKAGNKNIENIASKTDNSSIKNKNARSANRNKNISVDEAENVTGKTVNDKKKSAKPETNSSEKITDDNSENAFETGTPSKNNNSRNSRISNKKEIATNKTVASANNTNPQNQITKDAAKNKNKNPFSTKNSDKKLHTDLAKKRKTSKKTLEKTLVKKHEGSSVTSNGKPINVKSATDTGKSIGVVSSGGKGSPIDVKPATFKEKNVEVEAPATFDDKDKIINNGNNSKSKKETSLIEKEAPKKSYEITNSGIKIHTEEDDEPLVEEVEDQTAPAKADEIKDEHEEVLLATGSNPNPVSKADLPSGSGGASEPNVPLRNFNKLKFEGGIKAGYERGTNGFTTNTAIIAPFLQWNISPSFGIMLQPGFRYNSVTRSDIFNMTQAYHQINSATRDTAHKYVIDTIGTSSIQRNYYYNNIYDSILIGNKLKNKSYWEIEIPILLRFNAATNFAIFGGLSLTFGNLIRIEENRTTISGLQRNDSLKFAPVSPNIPEPQVPSANGYFTYNTPDVSTAPPTSNNQNPTTNPPRLGFMFGFSYELQDKFLFDVMVKKNISDMRFIPNEDVRKIYTQPYFRFMVGYKLFNNNKEKQVKNPNGL